MKGATSAAAEEVDVAGLDALFEDDAALGVDFLDEVKVQLFGHPSAELPQLGDVQKQELKLLFGLQDHRFRPRLVELGLVDREHQTAVG